MEKLLPFRYKIAGIACAGAATALSAIYFVFGLKITLPVFAVFSSYLETKAFTTFKTNFAEEIIILLFLAGFSMLVFSKEKNEIRSFRAVRIKALYKTVTVCVAWLALAVIFVYGNAFISVLIINIILPFPVYLVFFYTKKNRELKKDRLQKLQKRLSKNSHLF